MVNSFYSWRPGCSAIAVSEAVAGTPAACLCRGGPTNGSMQLLHCLEPASAALLLLSAEEHDAPCKRVNLLHCLETVSATALLLGAGGEVPPAKPYLTFTSTGPRLSMTQDLPISPPYTSSRELQSVACHMGLRLSVLPILAEARPSPTVLKRCTASTNTKRLYGAQICSEVPHGLAPA